MGNMVLIVEHDQEARRRLRRMLEGLGFDAVEASSVNAALELIQRLPNGFRLVLSQVEMPGMPGVALVETLRLFRPDLPVFCLSAGSAVGVTGGYPPVPDGAEELERRIRAFDEGDSQWRESSPLAAEVVRRARERYARTGDLLEAAYEVVKGVVPG